MTCTWTQALGGIATAIALVGYLPYFRDLHRGTTKPHAFSWLVWAILTGIAFAGQVTDAAGPGAWVTGFTAVVCSAIFVIALFIGEKQISLFDWICLGLSLGAIPLWVVTATPLWSVVLITIIDAVGFLPTFRKSYFKPWEETAVTYLLSGVKFVVALAALDRFSITTALYPLSLVLMNGAFVVMLLQRRQQLSAAVLDG
jgi:hypothetical protein